MDAAQLEDGYLRVRRAIASIAYANRDIDQQERELLASTMATGFQLTDDQLNSHIRDAIQQPLIEDLVTAITEPSFKRCFILDLTTLAI